MSETFYVLTDGGRARLVARNAATGAFVTLAEIDQRAEIATLRQELRASPPARSFEGRSGTRHAVGPDDHLRRSKEAFMERVAEFVAERAPGDGATELVLAAPPRLLNLLRARVEARTPVHAAIPKDLTKIPDHRLGRWLEGAAMGERRAS